MHVVSPIDSGPDTVAAVYHHLCTLPSVYNLAGDPPALESQRKFSQQERSRGSWNPIHLGERMLLQVWLRSVCYDVHGNILFEQILS
jgi:hypothetical protein